MKLEEEYDYLLIEVKNEKIAKDIRLFWGNESFYAYSDKLLNGSVFRIDCDMFESLLRLEKRHEIIFPKLVNNYRSLKRIDRTL
jgi:hypothetical protein